MDLFNQLKQLVEKGRINVGVGASLLLTTFFLFEISNLVISNISRVRRCYSSQLIHWVYA